VHQALNVIETEVALRSGLSRTQADELTLHLQSIGIDAHVQPAQTFLYQVVAPLDQAERGAQMLEEFDDEAALEQQALMLQTQSLTEQLPYRHGFAWVAGLIISNIALWWLLEQHGGSKNHTTLLRLGAITSSHLRHGEWWRLLSAQFLHVGLEHLFVNMTVLALLGGLALRMLGPGRLLTTYLFAGTVGNIAGYLFGSAFALKAGASGAILGLLGAVAGVRLKLMLRGETSRFRAWHILGMLLAFYGMVVGVRPESDHIAHVGGILGGALLTLLLPMPQAKAETFNVHPDS